MNRTLFTLFMIVVFALVACKGKTFMSDEVEEQDDDDTTQTAVDIPEEEQHETLRLVEDAPIPASADELFGDFFFSFTSDNHYQHSRISFPLKVNDNGSVRKVDQKHWADINPFPSQELYTVIYDNESDLRLQKDTTVRSVRVECIYLNDNQVCSYNFNRINSRWMLTDVDMASISSRPYGDFMNFYSEFLADSLTQTESIVQPLILNTPSLDGESESSVMELCLDDWFQFCSEMPLPRDPLISIDYGQRTDSPNRKVLLVEEASSGMFVKYKFNVIDGRWTLTEVEN